METLPRLAVVGAGALSSKRIYPNLGAAGARLVGVCDRITEKAERNAALFGGRAYTDLDAMLDAEQPDAVIVCVGPQGHPVLAQHVLRRGLPVYTEKPPAATAAACREVVEVARETGLLCVTAFKKRYTRAADRATAFLAEFPESARLALSIDYHSGPYRADRAPRHHLLDFSIHCLDLSCYLWGAPIEVFAYDRGDDAYAVIGRYANGSVASFSFTCGRSFSIPSEELELTLEGANFMTIHNSSTWRITRQAQCCEWREPPTFTSSGDDGHDTGHLAELVDFVTAVREGRRTSRSPISESYRTMVLFEAIVQSCDQGSPVRPCYDV